MRKWLRQRLLNLLVDGNDVEIKIYPGLNTVGGGSVKLSRQEVECESRDDIDLPDPISFRIQPVSGGTIVETRWWDKKKDETRVKLHIVTNEQNLSESIGKIATMELLQR